MNKKTGLIIAGILGIIVLICCCCAAVLILGNSGGTDKNGGKYTTETDPNTMVNVALMLETDLKLEDVRISEVTGGIIEIRTKTPDKVSPSALLNGSGYILRTAEPQFPGQISTFRLILTVNGLDATMIEASRKDIQDWTAKKITDQQFLNKLKRKSLVG